MKYLRHFDTTQEVQSFAQNFDGSYGVLLSCDEISTPLIIVPLPGVTVTFAATSQTYTYVYPYEPNTTVVNYINNIISEHEELLNEDGSFLDDIHDKNGNSLRYMLYSTLQEVGILAGDTISCVETWK